MSSSSRFPACYVHLPDYTEGRSATFYLAAEEYIARALPEDNYLFSWQLNPTVVMGRNQVAHAEIDLDFCRREGIDIVRRKSGGGAIFADQRNIMWSLITGEGAVEPLFADYAQTVAAALTALSVPACVSGRNDIVLSGGGKVCGNAFYHLTDRNIVHGTMLYDTNARLMQGALHPDTSKLESKGVKSVRSRVSLLKDFLPFGVDELRRRLVDLLCDRSIQLGDDDVKEIEEIEKPYHDSDYLFGSSAHSDAAFEGRIEGCGTLALHFHLRGSVVENVRLTGDFFELANAAEAFRSAFVGKAFTKDSLAESVKANQPQRSIRNLSETDLLKLLEV